VELGDILESFDGISVLVWLDLGQIEQKKDILSFYLIANYIKIK